MKRIISLLTALVLSISVYAQTAPAATDVIFKLNGEEMKGKVTKVSADDLTFIYAGETLEYTIKKADVNKIVFASGRTEVINQAGGVTDKKNDQVQMTASPAERHNKIAVLPFTFLLDKKPGADEIGYKAQDETFAYLNKYSAGYTFLDNRSTNAALIKAGVNKENMRGYTMKDICNILGVEYVVEGTVMQDKSTQTSYSSGNANTTVKKEDDTKAKASTYGSTFSSASQQYEMTVSLAIYNDTNANIYNQTRKAFFPVTDGSFTAPLEFLLKRTPLYTKK